MTALPDLIGLANKPNSTMQTDAIKALLEIDSDGIEVVPTLISLLESADADVKEHSVFALGRIGPAARSAIPALVRAFVNERSGDPGTGASNTGRCIAEALRDIRAQPHFVVPSMISILKDKRRSRLHRNALIALTGFGPSALPALPQLVDALGGSNVGVAAEVLGEIGGDARSALPALQAVLEGKNILGKQEAILAVLKINPSGSQNVDKYLDSVEDFYCRAFVLGYLGRSCAEGVGLARMHLTSLTRLLEKSGDYSPCDPHPAEYTISCLGRLGPSALLAVPTLTRLVRHRSVIIRTAASRALGRIERTAMR